MRCNLSHYRGIFIVDSEELLKPTDYIHLYTRIQCILYLYTHGALEGEYPEVKGKSEKVYNK